MFLISTICSSYRYSCDYSKSINLFVKARSTRNRLNKVQIMIMSCVCGLLTNYDCPRLLILTTFEACHFPNSVSVDAKNVVCSLNYQKKITDLEESCTF